MASRGMTRPKARDLCDRAARGCMRSAFEGRDKMTAMKSARDRLATANTLALQCWVSTGVSTLSQSGSLEGDACPPASDKARREVNDWSVGR